MTDNPRPTTHNWPGEGILLVGAVLAMVVTGCTSSNIQFGNDVPRLELAVPEPLADVEPMIVTRRLKTTFGPYTARKQRGTGRQWILPMGDLSFGKESSRLWFLFSEEAGAESTVECLNDDRYARLGSLTMRRELEEGEVLLACAEIDGAGEELWRLVVEHRRGTEAGYVQLGEREWRLVRGEPVTPMPYDDNLGFLLFDGDRAVAAVELEGRGRVWIAPELAAAQHRTAAAVAAAAISYEHRR